jgi:hypothetical protein
MKEIIRIFLLHQTHNLEKDPVSHSWSSTFLEEQLNVQPLKNSPAFYGTRRFITFFTKALHWSLS